MSLSLIDLWKSMGLFAKGIVVVLFIMSLWSLTIAIQKWWALRAARGRSSAVTCRSRR